jgi:hypothetical protein
MRIKLGPIIVFFIIYLFVWNLANAEEPKLNCEAFINENICNMSSEEQEIWFLELLKKILENVIEEKKIGIDV